MTSGADNGTSSDEQGAMLQLARIALTEAPGDPEVNHVCVLIKSRPFAFSVQYCTVSHFGI
jgi:hypothetical protein